MRHRGVDALVFAFYVLRSCYVQFNSTSKGGRVKCELFSLNIFLFIYIYIYIDGIFGFTAHQDDQR
jgi:hypothetical protein